MRYYKQSIDGYIAAIGTGGNHGETISETEYRSLLDAMRNAPAESGYVFRLREDLTWEKLAEDMSVPEDISDSEALSIILGGAV